MCELSISGPKIVAQTTWARFKLCHSLARQCKSTLVQAQNARRQPEMNLPVHETELLAAAGVVPVFWCVLVCFGVC